MRIGTEKVPMTPALKAEINKHVKFYGTGKKRFIIAKELISSTEKALFFFFASEFMTRISSIQFIQCIC